MYEIFGFYSVGVGENGTVCGFRISMLSTEDHFWYLSKVEVPFGFAHERLPEYIGVRNCGVLKMADDRDMYVLDRLVQTLPRI